MPYPSKLITFNLVVLVTTAQTTVVNKLWQVLLDEFLDLGNGLFQADLAGAGDVEIKGRVLRQSVSCPVIRDGNTHHSSRQALVGIVAAPGGDILQSQQDILNDR